MNFCLHCRKTIPPGKKNQKFCSEAHKAEYDKDAASEVQAQLLKGTKGYAATDVNVTSTPLTQPINPLTKKNNMESEQFYKDLYLEEKKNYAALLASYHEVKIKADNLKVDVDTLKKDHEYELKNLKSEYDIALREKEFALKEQHTGEGMSGFNMDKLGSIMEKANPLIDTVMGHFVNLRNGGTSSPSPKDNMEVPEALSGLDTDSQMKIQNLLMILQNPAECNNPSEIIKLYERILILTQKAPQELETISKAITKAIDKLKGK